MRQSFHFRDPRKTPSLMAVLKCAFRRPDDFRPGPTALDIANWVRSQPGLKTANVRASSDISEIRKWASEYTDTNGTPFYFVPPAEFERVTENKSRVSRFVVYRYNDPRAEAVREKEMMKQREAA